MINKFEESRLSEKVLKQKQAFIEATNEWR